MKILIGLLQVVKTLVMLIAWCLIIACVLTKNNRVTGGTEAGGRST